MYIKTRNGCDVQSVALSSISVRSSPPWNLRAPYAFLTSTPPTPFEPKVVVVKDKPKVVVVMYEPKVVRVRC